MLDRRVGELTCREVLTHLSEFLDGELTEEEVAKVTVHVNGCSNCEQFGGQFRKAVESIRGLSAPPIADQTVESLCRQVELADER